MKHEANPARLVPFTDRKEKRLVTSPCGVLKTRCSDSKSRTITLSFTALPTCGLNAHDQQHGIAFIQRPRLQRLRTDHMFERCPGQRSRLGSCCHLPGVGVCVGIREARSGVAYVVLCCPIQQLAVAMEVGPATCVRLGRHGHHVGRRHKTSVLSKNQIWTDVECLPSNGRRNQTCWFRQLQLL